MCLSANNIEEGQKAVLNTLFDEIVSGLDTLLEDSTQETGQGARA